MSIASRGTWAGRRGLLVAYAIILLVLPDTYGQQPGGKRPLAHTDYDSWRSIQGQQLSDDGKHLAYFLVPQQGDGEVVLRNLETGQEWRHPVGSRAVAATAPAKGPAAAAPAATARRLAFTADKGNLLFLYSPAKSETDAAQKAKKKADEMPRGGLGIRHLASGKMTLLPGAKSFQLPEQPGRFVAYYMGSQADPAAKGKGKGGKKGGGGPAAAPEPKKPAYGSDLIIRNLEDGQERTYRDVLEFSLSKDGKLLLFTVSSKEEEKNGVFAVAPESAEAPVPLLCGRGKYTKLTWDENQTSMAFLSDHGSTPDRSAFKIYYWERKPISVPVAERGGPARPDPPAATELVSAATPGFPTGMQVSDKTALTFSDDGRRLFLGVAPPPPSDKAENKDTPAEDKVVVELWHYKDEFIQPMQKVRAPQQKNRSYRAVYHLDEKKFVPLANPKMEQIVPTRDGRWAMGVDDQPYRNLVGVESGTFNDVYLIHTLDAARKPILRKQQGVPSWSPGGRFAVYYDGKDWNSLSVDGKQMNLTAKLGVRFGSEEFDSPSTPPPYGVAAWTVGDKDVLLYDRYDIWQVPLDGGDARNLTQGIGRKEKIQFRHVRLDPKEKAVDPATPLLLRAENEATRDTGFYRVRLGEPEPPRKLLMASKRFTPLAKAKDADVLLLTASTFNEFPDLHVTRSDFAPLKKASDANPQKTGLLWGNAELIAYKNADGVPLQGILIKPENFDPFKKYPMIVYIYEKLSQNLHQFSNPSPGTSINPAYYASNGYLVLMPDIAYTIGYPGQSALKCVLPAVQAVVDRGCVNEQAIGIQGHSWGGYQIAYMITQTNRFKAVAAGAPVSNMTSAYDGIRWGTGLPRQFQYEKTQSRIGGSLWQYPMRFVENSPVFMADRVKTPLLMLHNDQDDAVPWYQGIEYYLALRRLGKEVYLFNYVGELHGLRKRANQRDYTVRMQQFFDHYLKGAPRPEWMERGIPYRERPPEKKAMATD
jgi:dipeptidyl aminopeptidase/acylaminoacyl peptidase